MSLIARNRGECVECGFRFRLRTDGTVQSHRLWVGPMRMSPCAGSHLPPVCDADICDFCVHYRFNGRADAPNTIYTGDGECVHPEHPHPCEPYDGCDDFECRVCLAAGSGEGTG